MVKRFSHLETKLTHLYYQKNKTQLIHNFIVESTQNECYIELSNFDDLARYACAFREYPRRVYSQDLDDLRIISSSFALANTLLIFYAPIPKIGRYVSYQVKGDKEICDIVESTKNISHYAPIVHMESEISPLPVKSKKLSDQFHPIQVKDLGSSFKKRGREAVDLYEEFRDTTPGTENTDLNYVGMLEEDFEGVGENLLNAGNHGKSFLKDLGVR